MKILLLYDSYFGNTEKIAKAILESLHSHNVVFKKVEEYKNKDLKDIDVLILGSPTRAFNFSDNTMTFLAKISPTGLKGKKIITFDTRIDSKEVKPRILGFFMDRFGYASKKILKVLTGKGGEKIIEAEGFIVVDKEGPLRKGEIERAKDWIKLLNK